jgi:hypothetical protein
MKKFFIILILLFSFAAVAFCLRNFIEGTDYIVDFQEKSPEMAATLHINFIGVIPEPAEAEKIVKTQLKIFGNELVSGNKSTHLIKKNIRYKNIIGSAWYANNSDPANPIKVNFQEDLEAYVWIGKTKTIVTFPDYMAFLKKEQKNFKKKQLLDKSTQS